MKVAAETWKADKEVVLKIEEQVEKRQLKAADKVKVQLQSLSLIYNQAMAAVSASGDVEWERGEGEESEDLSTTEELEEIERQCSDAKKRAVHEAKIIVAEEDETKRKACKSCERSLCALQLLQREKALYSWGLSVAASGW
mmetsp:Transcript_53440/g.86541  ORF Transcript_53440/g.86541 Transcript_53440/m.86541 type:complete len:141 (-) Transcript_53440:262-684(-)